MEVIELDKILKVYDQELGRNNWVRDYFKIVFDLNDKYHGNVQLIKNELNCNDVRDKLIEDYIAGEASPRTINDVVSIIKRFSVGDWSLKKTYEHNGLPIKNEPLFKEVYNKLISKVKKIGYSGCQRILVPVTAEFAKQAMQEFGINNIERTSCYLIYDAVLIRTIKAYTYSNPVIQ